MVVDSEPRSRFTKSQRIVRKADYQLILSEGVRIRTPHFVLVTRPRPQDDAAARLGLIVSRKLGCAVVRNRIKRVVREAFRSSPLAHRLPLDLVVIAARYTPDLGRDGVRAEFLAVEPRLAKLAGLRRPSGPGSIGVAGMPQPTHTRSSGC